MSLWNRPINGNLDCHRAKRIWLIWFLFYGFDGNNHAYFILPTLFLSISNPSTGLIMEINGDCTLTEGKLWKHECNIFLWSAYDLYTRMLATVKNYDIINTDTRYCTLSIWAVALLLSEDRAVVNDIDVILHSSMLQMIYTIFF